MNRISGVSRIPVRSYSWYSNTINTFLGMEFFSVDWIRLCLRVWCNGEDDLVDSIWSEFKSNMQIFSEKK